MGESAIDDAGVDVAGAGEGGEGGFEGECVCLEPGEQCGVAEDARVGVLGGVDVCVCEIGELELVN